MLDLYILVIIKKSANINTQLLLLMPAAELIGVSGLIYSHLFYFQNFFFAVHIHFVVHVCSECGGHAP